MEDNDLGKELGQIRAAEREKERIIEDAKKLAQDKTAKAELEAKKIFEKAIGDTKRIEEEMLAAARREIEQEEKKMITAAQREAEKISGTKVGKDIVNRALKKLLE